jgi:hypothetical protein
MGAHKTYIYNMNWTGARSISLPPFPFTREPRDLADTGSQQRQKAPGIQVLEFAYAARTPRAVRPFGRGSQKRFRARGFGQRGHTRV